MKTIEVDDDELYSYIASHQAYRRERIRHLRRMLKFSATTRPTASAVKGTCGATVANETRFNPVLKEQSSRDA